MKNLHEHTITQAVLARNAETGDARLHEIMAGLIQHLDDFARETQLTEEEWDRGIQFLTAVGQICSPLRQEFILHSDTLGLSTLVTAQNNRKPEGCTEATVFGPFHVPNAPHFDLGADISEGLLGTPWFVRTHVRDIHGKPGPWRSGRPMLQASTMSRSPSSGKRPFKAAPCCKPMHKAHATFAPSCLTAIRSPMTAPSVNAGGAEPPSVRPCEKLSSQRIKPMPRLVGALAFTNRKKQKGLSAHQRHQFSTSQHLDSPFQVVGVCRQCHFCTSSLQLA